MTTETELLGLSVTLAVVGPTGLGATLVDVTEATKLEMTEAG